MLIRRQRKHRLIGDHHLDGQQDLDPDLDLGLQIFLRGVISKLRNLGTFLPCFCTSIWSSSFVSLVLGDCASLAAKDSKYGFYDIICFVRFFLFLVRDELNGTAL